jgi:hypothetical protein
LGRFLAPDSIVPDPGNPQALNRYSYSYNNPLRYTDSSGHIPEPMVRLPDWSKIRIDISDWSNLGKALAVAGCLAVNCVVDYQENVLRGPTPEESAGDIVALAPVGMVAGPLKQAGEQASKAFVQEGLDLTAQSVRAKLTGYLLNESHPKGGTKAIWFKQALGFTQDNLEALAPQIKFDPATAVESGITEFGVKYNQTIQIIGANGKTIDVVFAWMKSATDGIVRLVTAIPTKQ